MTGARTEGADVLDSQDRKGSLLLRLCLVAQEVCARQPWFSFYYEVDVATMTVHFEASYGEGLPVAQTSLTYGGGDLEGPQRALMAVVVSTILDAQAHPAVSSEPAP